MRQHQPPTHLNWHPKAYILVDGAELAALAAGAFLALLVFTATQPWAPPPTYVAAPVIIVHPDSAEATGQTVVMAVPHESILPRPLRRFGGALRLVAGGLTWSAVALVTFTKLPQRARARWRYRRLPAWAVYGGKA